MKYTDRVKWRYSRPLRSKIVEHDNTVHHRFLDHRRGRYRSIVTHAVTVTSSAVVSPFTLPRVRFQLSRQFLF